MPSRKVTIAAGRPASLPSTLPARFFTGCGQVMPRLARCSISAEKERQIALGDAPLVERQDEIAAAGMDQKIRILDALGDALVGQQLADVVAGEKAREVFRRDIGIDRHESLQRLRG